MTPNFSPKYPRQNGVAGRRLLIRAVALVLIIGGALLYVVDNNALPGESTLDTVSRMAASVAQAPKEQNPEEQVPEEQTAGQSALSQASPDAPLAGQAVSKQKTPEQEASASNAVLPTPLQAKTAPSPGLNPEASRFADMSLDQVATGLARKYARRLPLRWGERMPGITNSLLQPGGAGAVLWRPTVLALTLDACGGKKGDSYDAGIIEYLRKNNIPATIFVTSLWIKNNEETLKDLAADSLFEIAAHGQRHKPASVTGRSVFGITGTSSVEELVHEVEGNARDIEKITGKRPRWFRAGTAFYDDVAISIIDDLGFGIAGYSIACDDGATLSSARVTAKTLTAKHGDILLLHMNKPHGGSRDGLLQALPELLQHGARFVRLSDAPDGEQ